MKLVGWFSERTSFLMSNTSLSFYILCPEMSQKRNRNRRQVDQALKKKKAAAGKKAAPSDAVKAAAAEAAIGWCVWNQLISAESFAMEKCWQVLWGKYGNMMNISENMIVQIIHDKTLTISFEPPLLQWYGEQAKKRAEQKKTKKDKSMCPRGKRSPALNSFANHRPCRLVIPGVQVRSVRGPGRD